jgi:hypothetical protein
VEQELLTLPEHLSSPSCFNRFRVAWSLVLWVVVCTLLFVNLFIFLFGHCIVCPLIYGFLLPLWYLRFMASYYPFGIFDLRLLITPLVSLIYGFLLPLWYLWFTASYYLFGMLDLRLLITSLVSLISGFLLPLWYLWFTASYYPFGILDLRLLITSLVC